jgi:hypothetical protein
VLRPRVDVDPFAAGLALGFGAALVQAFFKAGPPVATGFCMICHPADMVNWLANHIVHSHLHETFASGPTLTAMGVVLGSLLAAIQHQELHFRAARSPVLYFSAGLLTVGFGRWLHGCPIRMLLLTAYGGVIGLVGAACVALGVGLGTLTLRWRARRALPKATIEREVTA